MTPSFLEPFNFLFLTAVVVIAMLPALVLTLNGSRLRGATAGVIEGTTAAGVLGLWLVVALAATVPGLLASTDLPVNFATSFGGGLGVGSLMLIVVPAVRRRIVETPLDWVVRLQAARLIGGTFLIWALLGQASWTFALIAGLGDIVVGLSAFYVADQLSRGAPSARGLALGHAVLGMLDFVAAFTTAALTGASLTWPGQLIPVFLVPLAMLLHLWVFVALWRTRQSLVPLRPAAGPEAAR